MWLTKNWQRKAELMEQFIQYLKAQGHTTKTVKHLVSYTRQYLDWIKANHHQADQLDYPQLLSFIGYLQDNQTSKGSINDRLRALTHYYNYQGWANIASTVRLRGTIEEHVLLLTEEELDTVYNNWTNPTKHGYQRHSNKLLLSLVIYQGLIKSDIDKLELNHINLEKGTLQVPGGSQRKRARTLSLEAFQIIPFHEYIQNHRAKAHPLQTDDPSQSQKLFSPNCDKAHRLHDQFKVINKQLRSIIKEIPFKKLNQLQQSRIAIWIQQHGLRKAQYLAGYRSIDKIEKYQKQNPNDLKEVVLKYHPLQ